MASRNLTKTRDPGIFRRENRYVVAVLRHTRADPRLYLGASPRAGIALLRLRTTLWQNLGAAPQTNVAVQGQTGAQPEGAFLNFVNWVGNVIAPVGAGGAVVGAIVSWLTGRGFGRWLFAAGALLAVSGVTSRRLNKR